MLKKIYHKLEQNFPFIEIFKKAYSKIFLNEPRRYKYLFEIIRNNKSRKIMEIGIWNGERALQMINEAKKDSSPEEIQYFGFDLFELMEDKTAKKEFIKTPLTLENIKNKLEKTKVKVRLYKGNTTVILPKVINELPKMDFIFIDGGHSISTIKNDWNYVQKIMDENTVVVFDDYWNRDDAGCKKIIEEIDNTKYEVIILPIQDKFKVEGGILKINFVKVTKIKRHSI